MNVLIVDDEKPARDRLRQILADEAPWDVVGEAANGLEALKLAGELAPDIVLLDIRMPGMEGIEAAHHLNAMERPPAVVFTTAYDEYAIDAFEARAIGYVLKPVRRARLVRALEQAGRLAPGALGEAAATLDAQRRHVCARAHGELKLIPVDEVTCFRADQKYVAVDHDGGRDLIDDSLKSLEAEFGDRFVRVHRGALVAVDRIRRIDKNAEGKSRVVLRDDSQVDDEQLIISRRHVAEVKRRLKGS
ncbi:MAG: LytTR family DNA-binding domain-containing protein [Gammaproteobacteria bacterium]|nr:LytTR family DNA-binding domain-containing protein [Gammaproteobacteria bacterium]NNF50586.1 response regulator transcription factor [Woeseiaceae bacterium]MBT8093235.1 LytTR family DNA-binding domain-containing protein [Gammaproteobacteria bacterium]MBT8106041.1 LytTR family DNA-binding domain-containing protein [Gammaproteobacteria bacterium]NNK26055.1 response regulator transcription factor [Woeseiaceae bacterium]